MVDTVAKTAAPWRFGIAAALALAFLATLVTSLACGEECVRFMAEDTGMHLSLAGAGLLLLSLVAALHTRDDFDYHYAEGLATLALLGIIIAVGQVALCTELQTTAAHWPDSDADAYAFMYGLRDTVLARNAQLRDSALARDKASALFGAGLVWLMYLRNWRHQANAFARSPHLSLAAFTVKELSTCAGIAAVAWLVFVISREDEVWDWCYLRGGLVSTLCSWYLTAFGCMTLDTDIPTWPAGQQLGLFVLWPFLGARRSLLGGVAMVETQPLLLNPPVLRLGGKPAVAVYPFAQPAAAAVMSLA